jgi:hypothetical protein
VQQPRQTAQTKTRSVARLAHKRSDVLHGFNL